MSEPAGNKAEDPGTLSALSGPQLSALCVLAGGGRKVEAAEAAGVHPQRLSEWLRLPHFRAALDDSREELVAQASNELRSLAQESVATLRDVLRTGAPTVRLRAAAYVLDRVLLIARTGIDGAAEQAEGEIELQRFLCALGLTA